MLIGLGLLALDVPLAAPLVAEAFVAVSAPVVGVIAVGGPPVLVAPDAQGTGTGAELLLVLVVQQLGGNVLPPCLRGRRLRQHAGVVPLSIFLRAKLFEVAGAFLSVPSVAVAAVVVRYVSRHLDRRAEQDVLDRV